MLLFNKVILIVLFCSFYIALSAQTTEDFKVLTSLVKTQKKLDVKDEFKENLTNDGSEFQIISTSFFYIYKEFISTQDFNHCVFYPSCSVYGIECIKNHGLIKGGMMTFDRLTRCNGFSSEKYEKDYDRQSLVDPVITK